MAIIRLIVTLKILVES